MQYIEVLINHLDILFYKMLFSTGFLNFFLLCGFLFFFWFLVSRGWPHFTCRFVEGFPIFWIDVVFWLHAWKYFLLPMDCIFTFLVESFEKQKCLTLVNLHVSIFYLYLGLFVSYLKKQFWANENKWISYKIMVLPLKPSENLG